MPLPEKFYDADGKETTLDILCVREPAWAANRIRTLTEQVDNLPTSQPSDRGYQIVFDTACPKCGADGYRPEVCPQCSYEA